MKKDCANCVNCDCVSGNMANCSYPCIKDGLYKTVEQMVPRSHADRCVIYAERKAGNDEVYEV